MIEQRAQYHTKADLRQSETRHRVIRLVVLGVPMGKQRARTYLRANGRVRSVTPEKTKTAEAVIRWYWQESHQEPFPPETALEMTIELYLPKPPSAPKKRQRPTVKPDWDNCGKLVSDALNSLAYDDDSRIVDAHIHKHYVKFPEEPRLVIEIREARGL